MLRCAAMGSWVLAVLLVCLGSPLAGAQWTDQTIAGVPEFSLSESGVQIDAAGHPHVFVGGDRVYHEWQDAGGWHREVVDPTPRSGERLRAAMGPSGEFHLVYVRNEVPPFLNPLNNSVFSQKSFRYATNASGSWVAENIPSDFAPEAGQVTGLAVDASHVPHLLFVDLNGPIHGFRSGGSWSFEPIDISGAAVPDNPGNASQLAADHAGNLHAIWFVETSAQFVDHLVYGLRDSSGWHVQQLDTGPFYATGDSGAVLADGANAPHIIAAGGGVLFHLTHSAAGWAIENAGTSRSGGLSAAFDGTGHLHVLAFANNSMGQLGLEHVARGDSSWSTEAGLIVPIADAARIALGAGPMGDLDAAVLIPQPNEAAPLLHLHRHTTWSSETIDQTGPVANDGELGDLGAGSAMLGADVQLGLVGAARRILYRNGTQSSAGTQIYHAAESDSGFSLENIAHSPVAIHALRLLFDSQANERAIWANGPVTEAVRKPSDGSWNATALPDSLDVPLDLLPAVVDDGGALHLFTLKGAGFGQVEIDARSSADDFAAATPVSIANTSGIPASSAAVAQGPLGALHLAFLEGNAVKYATNQTGTWTTTSVGSVDGLGTHAVTVQPNGNVDVVYERNSGLLDPTLFFATNRCPGPFYAMEVDPTVTTVQTNIGQSVTLGSRNPSLVLDAVGNPHVSYRRAADQSIGYAHIVSGVWAHETAVANTLSGEQSAIAIDGDGAVSIAHHDFWAGDLHLATRAPIDPEPAWNGCPPLPDPNALQDGHFVFESPPGTVPLYDPDFSSEATQFGSAVASFRYTMEANEKGRLSTFGGTVDVDGDRVDDASFDGVGRVSSKRGAILVLEVFVIEPFGGVKETGTLLVAARLESIDPITHGRRIVEALAGRKNHAKVRLKQTSQDTVPANRFGVRLELTVVPGSKPNTLAVTGVLAHSGSLIALTGTGSWFPTTQTANFVLKGHGSKFQINGAHIWQSHSDGVFLSADSIALQAFGQKLKADLHGAF